MKRHAQIPVILLVVLFFHSCQQATEDQKEAKEETEDFVTHRNGQVHDPCTSCAKKSGDTTPLSYTIKDYVYFQPKNTEEILLCFNNDLVDYRSGSKSFMAEISPLMTLQVDRISYNFFYSYDLCDSGKCTHDHPTIPERIVIDSTYYPNRYSGKIENRFTKDDLYKGDLTYGLVTIDNVTPFGDASFILVNSNRILLKEGETVTFRVAELEAQVDGSKRLFHLAFDAKY